MKTSGTLTCEGLPGYATGGVNEAPVQKVAVVDPKTPGLLVSEQKSFMYMPTTIGLPGLKIPAYRKLGLPAWPVSETILAPLVTQLGLL